MQTSSFFNMKYNVVYFLEINKSFHGVEQVFPKYHSFPNIEKYYLFPDKRLFFWSFFQLWEKKSIVDSNTVQNNCVTLHKYRTE